MLKQNLKQSFLSINHIHRFAANNNSNFHKKIMINTIRKNYYYLDEGLHNIYLEEESNINATRFFEFLKNFDELLWDECTPHNKLPIIT